MSDLSRYKALIFDIDNTLYDYDACDKKAYEAVTKYMRNKSIVSSFDAMLTSAKDNVKKHLNDTASSHNRMLYFKFIADHYMKDGHKALKMYDIYNKAFYRAMQKYRFDDVYKFLKRNLKSKEFIICASTDMMCEVQLRKLEALNELKLFNFIWTSEENGHEKPDIGMYNSPISYFNIDIEKCLFIGDNEEKDIKGPMKVSMNSVNIKKFRKEILF